MSRRDKLQVSNRYAYQGPLGEIVEGSRYFFAWKDGHLLGTHGTLEEAMESLVWREHAKDQVRDDPIALLEEKYLL
jgi:hypothetical protein